MKTFPCPLGPGTVPPGIIGRETKTMNWNLFTSSTSRKGGSSAVAEPFSILMTAVNRGKSSGPPPAPGWMTYFLLIAGLDGPSVKRARSLTLKTGESHGTANPPIPVSGWTPFILLRPTPAGLPETAALYFRQPTGEPPGKSSVPALNCGWWIYFLPTRATAG